MADKKKGSIGFDPLAWMKGGDDGRQSGEDSCQSSVVSRQSTSTPTTQADSHPSAAKTDDLRPATVDAPATPGAIALGDCLTIEHAAAMHAELGRHLGTKNVVLEAGNLTRIDTAGLQLLTAFVRAAEGRGARVEWRAPQAALRESARRLGLEGALHLS